MINTFFHKLQQWYLYSSVRKFVIMDTDENGENWYMTNNNQFTVFGRRVAHVDNSGYSR